MQMLALASTILFSACWISIALAQPPDAASRVYAKASKSVFLVVVRSSSGDPVSQATGFLIEGNRIVTNEHAIRGGAAYLDFGAIRVALKPKFVDPVNDLAVMTPNGEVSASPLTLANVQPSPGTSIYALGNPAGLEKSISSGVVAGIRNISGRELLQISAPISPGSSGGPILNSEGNVVGVAVGALEHGQNLNFAVPTKILQALLSGNARRDDLPSVLSKIEALTQKRWEQEYSEQPESPFQRIEGQIAHQLSLAIELAGSDLAKLKLVADKALECNPVLAVAAAERIIKVRPSGESYVVLAKSLKAQYATEAEAKKSQTILEKADRAIRTAFKMSKQPNAEMHYLLGDILEDRSSYAEARTNFVKASELAKGKDDRIFTSALRGLIRTSDSMGSSTESNRWFQALLDSGDAGAWDWQQQADRQSRREEYAGAGDSYEQAALMNKYAWQNWCKAASHYSVAGGGHEDRVLEAARACIKEGAGKKGSDRELSLAHRQIADVLNRRGVYEEGISQAREAIAINPNDAFNQDTLADSLIGLRRFQEAINASKQAIRLSDGKYSWMHFTLGLAHFETENWELARQSFEKAAELDAKNDTAAYNIALCYTRLRSFNDAARWYEEALRRNPNHKDKQDILMRIQRLRQ